MMMAFFLLQPVSVVRLLAAVVLLFVLVAFTLAQSPASQQEQEQLRRTFSVVTPAQLTVENLKGTIHVAGTDGDKVTVNVHKKFRGSEKERKRWMAETKIDLQNDPGHVSVKVEYPDRNCEDTCRSGLSTYTAWVELDIEVPHQMSVQLNGHKPDITVASIQGDIMINSHKSPIQVRSCRGSVEIKTFKESVELKDVAITGTMDIRNDKGTVTIEAKSLGKEVRLETDKGTITLRMPAGTGADVDFVGGKNSSFHSAFPVAGSTVGRSVREIHGTIGQGGTTMRLRANKGSIELEAAP